MTIRAVAVRRSFTVVGVVLSLLIGAATIRAAAAWTAAAGSTASQPPTVESLQAALVAEQERSTALQSQLDRLTTGSTDLGTALEAARKQIATDTAQAQKLRDSLATAKSRLAALERSIRAAAAGRAQPATTRTTTAPAATNAPTEPPEYDDD